MLVVFYFLLFNYFNLLLIIVLFVFDCSKNNPNHLLVKFIDSLFCLFRGCNGIRN